MWTSGAQWTDSAPPELGASSEAGGPPTLSWHSRAGAGELHQELGCFGPQSTPASSPGQSPTLSPPSHSKPHCRPGSDGVLPRAGACRPLGRGPGLAWPQAGLEVGPDQPCSPGGHPTNAGRASALLSTGATEQAPGLLVLCSTWPGPPPTGLARPGGARGDRPGTPCPRRPVVLLGREP